MIHRITKRCPVLVLIGLCGLTSACGSSPSSPSPTTPATTQTKIIRLEGNMSMGAITLGQTFSATLRVYNDGNAPLTVTGITGTNGITAVTKASWTSGTIAAGSSQAITISFTPAAVTSYSGTISITADQTSGTNTIAFSGSGSLDGIPLFVQSGVGDNTFTIPSYVTRIKVDATYSGSSQNFIVRISTQLTSLINIIIGTSSFADSRSPWTGTYAIANGGTVTITSSTGVAWTFTEVR